MTEETCPNGGPRYGRMVSVGEVVGDLKSTMEAAYEAMKPHMEREREERAAAAEKAAAEDEAAKDLQWRAFMRRIGIPADHVDVLRSSFDETKRAVVQAARWRASDKRLLVLSGAVGTGKTQTACWLLAQGSRRPYQAPDGRDLEIWPPELWPQFVTSTKLARLSMFRSPEYDLLERCSVLVIDEVGSGDIAIANAWADRLESFVSARYAARLDTIITTNLHSERRSPADPPEFREMFGERLFDRVSGSGGAWVVTGGPSLRQGGRP